MKLIKVGKAGHFKADLYISHGLSYDPEIVKEAGQSWFKKPKVKEVDRWQVWVYLTSGDSFCTLFYDELEAQKACDSIAKQLKVAKL